MAGARRSWSWPLAAAALGLALSAGTALLAQAAASGGTGSIAGRLTDLHSTAVENAVVVARNEATGAEARTTTQKNGSFRFSGLEAGAYTVEAESERLGRGRLEGILVSAGAEARVQAAMEFKLPRPEAVREAAAESVPVGHPADEGVSARIPSKQPAEEGLSASRATAAGIAPVNHPAEEGIPAGTAIRHGAGEGLSAAAAPGAEAARRPEPRLAMMRREIPATVTPEVTETLAEEGLLAAPLPGRRLEAAKGSAGSVSGAGEAGVAKAAMPAGPLRTPAPVEAALLTGKANLAANGPGFRAFISASGGRCRDDTTYYYKVVAKRADGATASSAELAVTTGRSGSNSNTIWVGGTAAAKWPAGTTGLVIGGRAKSGGELKIGAVNLPETYFADTCTRTPQGAMPLAAATEAASGKVETAEGSGPVAEAVTTTVSGAELERLPASGRRWQDFELDTPTAAATEGGEGQISLLGAGQEPAETTIDGANTRLAFGGQGGSRTGPSEANGQSEAAANGMGQAWAGGRGTTVAEAAIREVETAAGDVEAKEARAAGGQVDVETERGGKGLHGQGFVYDLQNTWGAQNPFSQWVTETGEFAPLAPYNTTLFPVFDNYSYQAQSLGPPESYTPPDHEMVWGVGVGGPIRSDKLFWFGALDSYRRNDPGLPMVRHPYLEQIPSNCPSDSRCSPTLTGFFAEPSDDTLQVLSSRLGLSSANPAAEGLTAYSTMLETLAGLLGPAPRTAAQWTGFGRLDWNTTERQSFTLEGIGANWNSPGGGLTSLTENYGNHSFGNSQASEQWLLGRWERFLTPNLLAVTQGSAGREILSEYAGTPSAFEQTFLGPNAYGQLPQIVVDNRYGFTIGNPSRFGQGDYPDERLYEGQETVDWVRGNVLVKAGFDVSHNADATSMLRNQTGTYTYSNVENFASDALTFAKYGLGGGENAYDQHGCDQTGKVWRDSGGGLRGLGDLPCYSYFSQTLGPTDWHLSTDDWAGFLNAQWEPGKLAVLSAGLRWEREQLPGPIAALWPPPVVPPETSPPQGLPSLGNDWGPRVGLAVGNAATHWPVLRLGYGMYFGRTANAMVETALTQTGSPNGDLNIFMRATDDLPNNGGGAPPFPYVPTGPPGSVVKPGVVEFAANFRNPEVHQAVAAVEENLPGHVEVTASAVASLGRRLPVYIDANLATPTPTQTITYTVVDGAGLGPIKTPTITVPFYASWPSPDCPGGAQLNIAGQCGWINPDYQGINQITSKANSIYEAAMLKVVRYGRRGLSLHAHYTYSHAMDWNPDASPLDPSPADFSQEYGTSSLDIRHSAAAMAVYEAPWKLRGAAGRIGNGWMVSGIGLFRSGLPYTMRVSGSLAKEFDAISGAAIAGLGPGMNGSGGDNRVYGVGRNTFRYPATWKADLRLGKSFDLGEMRKLEVLLESFNLFNHQNVTELETTGYTIDSGTGTSPPTLNFLTGPEINEYSATEKANSTAFGQPLSINATNFYRERQIEVGVRMRF